MIPAAASSAPAKTAEAGGTVVDAVALRAWAGMGPCAACSDTQQVECPECEGAGSRPKLCDDCDHEHDCACGDCEDGKAECRSCSARRAGHIERCVMDRSLLAQALRFFPESGEYRVLGDPDHMPAGCLYVWTDTAWLLLMGLQHLGREAVEAPHFPPCASKCSPCAALAEPATEPTA